MSTTRIHDKAQGTTTRDGSPPPGSGRRRTGVRTAVVAGTLALVALVAAGAVLALMPADDGPATPGSAPTAEEAVAQDFLSAYTTSDAQRVALHLADDATMPQEWWRDLQRYEAWGAVFLVQPCEAMSTSVAGTNISCAFEHHALGTDALGREPFDLNAFTLRVDDGKVESFQATFNPGSNGFVQQLDAVASWVRANHPGDWRFMDSYEDVSDADLPRWLQLWETRIAQYVDSWTTD